MKWFGPKECSVMYYSLIFGFIAVVTATLGFVGPAGITATVMKICFGVSFLLLTISLGRGSKT
jgi:uncharacterized membrane protein YtjA (UPF0391 family)